MTMTSILNIPQAIFTSICSDWLVCTDLGRLDASFSNTKLRALYLSWIKLGRIKGLEDINHHSIYESSIAKELNVHAMMFGELEWLRSRFGEKERLPMAYFYVCNPSDLLHFTYFYTNFLHHTDSVLYEVDGITLIVNGTQFSRFLPMVLELFPTIKSLELQFEGDPTLFLQGLIANHSMFDSIQSVTFTNGLYIPEERRFQLLFRRFLQLFGSKVRSDVDNINLLLHGEYCRSMTSLGRRFSHPLMEPETAWPIISQFSQLTHFDYGLFMSIQGNMDEFAYIPPSIHEVCASFACLQEVIFSRIQTSLRLVVDVVQHAKNIKSIQHPSMTWKKQTNYLYSNHSVKAVLTPNSRIKILSLIRQEDFPHFRHFMTFVPQMAFLECPFCIDSHNEDGFLALVTGLLLDYAESVKSLILHPDGLLSAFLSRLPSFGMLTALSIRSGPSPHFYGQLKSNLLPVVSSLPKLRSLNLKHLDELQDDDMLVLLQNLPCLASVSLVELHRVTKKTLYYMSQLKRVWRRIDVNDCPCLGMDVIHEAIDVHGLLVLLLDYYGSNRLIQLGYGLVPISASAVKSSL